MSFTQCKIGFILDEEFPNLSDVVCDGNIFNTVDDGELPDGWSLSATDIAGASGFVLIFNIVKVLPTTKDCDIVKSYLKDLEKEFED